jgi:prepilin-type N-terminal cleavage/methylation domain-containing protein
MRDNARQPGTRARRYGFTLVELLIVISIIAILIALVVVAARGVRRSAATTRTTSMLATINQAIAQFKGDLGFEPPLITEMVPSAANATVLGGGFLTPELKGPVTGGTAANTVTAYRERRYNSQFSLPAYLLGMGAMGGRPSTPGTLGHPPNTTFISESASGYREAALDDGVPGPGFRNPGPLRAWKKAGSTPNTLVHSPDLSGRSYGPYLDPKQMAEVIELVEVVPSTMRARIAGLDSSSNIWMYRFIEPSGEPIRYYRQWPTRDAGTSPPNLPSTLRIPVELRSGEALAKELGGAVTGTPGTPLPADSDLLSASYMLLAANGDTAEKNLNPTAALPFEFASELLFEQCMPFISVTDPKFNASSILGGADAQIKSKGIIDFAQRAVRLGPQ